MFRGATRLKVYAALPALSSSSHLRVRLRLCPSAPETRTSLSHLSSRNLVACCSAEGGEKKSENQRDAEKRQEARPSKGFGTSSRDIANADAEVSNTDALLQSLSSLGSGRDQDKSHLVLSDDTSPAGWREIDERVNDYPIERNFQAIGSGGEDFKKAMVAAVESVLGSVPENKVATRASSGGKYCSVNIGPLTVATSEQLTAIYQAMATDTRLKWWM
mmetsp:Transcript_10168/g.19147  ORF Transcript_10168/g.19147 Transcript_10168/m.19147 type:complete len:218 (+) Transcript_10168:107-760(+)